MAWTVTTRTCLGFRVHLHKLRKLHSSPARTDVLAAPSSLIIFIHLSSIFERWLKPMDPNFGSVIQKRSSLSWNVVHRVVSLPGSKNNDTSGKRYEHSTAQSYSARAACKEIRFHRSATGRFPAAYHRMLSVSAPPHRTAVRHAPWPLTF